MNKFILIAMDKESYTDEELKKNAEDAFSVYCAEDARAVYDLTTSDPAAAAASYASYDASDFTEDYLEYCLDLYFEKTGEDRQDYINAIKGNK